MTTHNIVVFGGDHCGPEVCDFSQFIGCNYFGTSMAMPMPGFPPFCHGQTNSTCHFGFPDESQYPIGIRANSCGWIVSSLPYKTQAGQMERSSKADVCILGRR